MHVAIDVLGDGVVSPLDHQYICCQMIFVKMEDFWYKAWLVAEGHTLKAPATLTQVSIASQETMCIVLLLQH